MGMLSGYMIYAYASLYTQATCTFTYSGHRQRGEASSRFLRNLSHLNINVMNILLGTKRTQDLLCNCEAFVHAPAMPRSPDSVVLGPWMVFNTRARVDECNMGMT